jgi:hypothetical protein
MTTVPAMSLFVMVYLHTSWSSLLESVYETADYSQLAAKYFFFSLTADCSSGGFLPLPPPAHVALQRTVLSTGRNFGLITQNNRKIHNLERNFLEDFPMNCRKRVLWKEGFLNFESCTNSTFWNQYLYYTDMIYGKVVYIERGWVMTSRWQFFSPVGWKILIRRLATPADRTSTEKMRRMDNNIWGGGVFAMYSMNLVNSVLHKEYWRWRGTRALW